MDIIDYTTKLREINYFDNTYLKNNIFLITIEYKRLGSKFRPSDNQH
jgi:hypothetical protein